MLNLILFGAPGSGKGTQAAKLLDKYHLVHISTGDLLRKEIREETPLGKEAQKFIDSGLLVPDEVVIGIISSQLDLHLQNGARGFIFDGFPRTVPQAEALDKLLNFKETQISKVIALKVEEEELIKRLLIRGETSGRADDQDRKIIEKRVKEYEIKTSPVADYYRSQGKYVAVKGEGSINDIFDRICKEVEKVNS